MVAEVKMTEYTWQMKVKMIGSTWQMKVKITGTEGRTWQMKVKMTGRYKADEGYNREVHGR